jgi:PAS domain S-box-containing protein
VSVDAADGDGEELRLASLERLGVLERPTVDELEDVASLAGRLLDAPYAAVVFVDRDRAWTKAVRGEAPLGSMPREVSAAHLAIIDGAELIVERADRGPLASHPAARQDPSLRRFAAAVVRAPDGEPVGAVEVGWSEPRRPDARDRVTLQRVAAHAARLLELRSEASEYRRFIDLNPDPVAVLDLDGCIELANPALADLLDAASTEELRGRSFLELVVAEERTWVAAELARVLFARLGTTRLDLGLRRLDGTEVRCSVSAGHLRGGRRSLQLVIHDLDERIRAEEERTRLAEQLAQAQRLDLAGRLASGLAHDLKNLTTVISANLDMATSTLRRWASDGPDPGPVLEDLDQVRIVVERANVLTTKLMQFARQEPAGDEQVEVDQAVDAVRRLVGSSLARGVSLEVELADGLPPIAADPVQLEQALINLVMNASDASHEGDVVRLIARRFTVDGPRGTVMGARTVLDPTREYVCFEVIDQGTGMDPQTLTRAFEPLFSTKGAVRGTGLGLPTVLAFAHQVDGAATLESKLGEGTCATLVVPASPPTTLPPERGHPGAGAKVVLADPNERARRVVAQMLRTAGYRVTAVASGEEALEALASGGVDALVTELALPGLPGWRTVELAHQRSPNLPVLLFTSTQAPTRFDHVATLVKPFSSDRLLRTLGDLIATS